MPKKTYTLSVEWSMVGVMHIEAESEDRAIEMAYEQSYLPDDVTYLDDSFEVTGVTERKTITGESYVEETEDALL